MSSFLLDTHIVVWLATSPDMIPSKTRRLLEEADQLNVSAATAYEIGQKVRLGRLPQARALVLRWPQLLERMMADELPLRAEEMLHAASLAWDHRDPFDRMIVAQAQLRGLSLVTKDASIRAFCGETCLAWS